MSRADTNLVETETHINPKNASMWAVSGDTYMPCEKTENRLPPNQYTIELDQMRGLFFKKAHTVLDELIPLPDAESDKIIKHVQQFWQRKEVYKKMNVLHKRGVLLWGPPGSGKTTTIQQLSFQVIAEGGVSIYVKDPEIAARGLDYLRKIEPDRPVVVMLEDIDAMTQGRHDNESNLLALLDGELQIDNVVFVATTNYPERLDKRLINRPSRFDIVHKIDMPGPDARRTYLLHKMPELETMEYPNDDSNTMKKDIANQMEKLDIKVNEARNHILQLNQENEKLDNPDSPTVARNNARIRNYKGKLDAMEKEQEALASRLGNVDDNKKLIDYWIEKTHNFSIAHLKELVISVFVYDTPFSDAHKRLEKMATLDINSSSAGSTNL